jgi:hypothetical protein
MTDGSTSPLLGSSNGVGNGAVGVSVSSTGTGNGAGGINAGTSMDGLLLDDDDDDSSIADSNGSCPQIITNDLKSLDEMVSVLKLHITPFFK